MLKIAKKLIVLVIVMVLGVLVFIWYRSSQPPALLGLVPENVKEAGFVDVRNLMKKVYNQGATNLNELQYPEFLTNLFMNVKDIKEPGLNLFSEIVWFKHQEDYNCIFVRLTNPEKWEAFLKKYKDPTQLDNVQKTDDISYVRFDEQYVNALFAWRGKHLALIYNSKEEYPLSYSQAVEVLKPEKYNKTLNKAYDRAAPDIFFIDLTNKQTLSLKLLAGKIRYVFNEYEKEINDFPQFFSLKINEDKLSSDTSVFIQSAKYIKESENVYSEDSLLKNNQYNALMVFQYQLNDSSEIHEEKEYLKEIPKSYEDFGIIKPERFIYLSDFYSKSINCSSCNYTRLTSYIEKFEDRTQTSGTYYFSEKEKLLFKEVADFAMKNKVFK